MDNLIHVRFRAKQIGQDIILPDLSHLSSTRRKRRVMVSDLDLKIRQCYYFLSISRKGLYSEASQLSVLKLLTEFYVVKISRRTLNYHLRYLEDSGDIKRVRRHKKGAYGRIMFHTTLVVMQSKCIKYLKDIANWFRRTKLNSWTLKGLNLDAPSSDIHALMISTYLKTTSG